MEGIRRVVTGHDESGKAVFASDGPVEPFVSVLGNEFVRLWGGDETPRFPDDGEQPPWTSYFPPVGGFRFGLFSVPPAGHEVPEGIDLAAEYAKFDQAVPGLVQYMEPEDPGMHTTPTIDFEVVLSGEVVLELDDGAEVTLRPGDTVVQNGTRHRWRNNGSVPAVLAVFIAGAQRERFG